MERRFGFIRDKLDIKVLILFILQRISEPVSLDELAELTLCDGAISYFDFAECVSELVASDHISADGDRYLITEKGARNGAITEGGLPYSVRVKAERTALRFLYLVYHKKNRNSNNRQLHGTKYFNWLDIW